MGWYGEFYKNGVKPSTHCERRAILRETVFDNKYSIIKDSLRGNNWWVVLEHNITKEREIVLVMLHWLKDEWQYKMVSENCSPWEINCPISYLNMSPCTSCYSKQWRDKVMEYWGVK